MDSVLFIPDKVYKRSDIHDQYGGNRQGGIAPSAKFHYIFIFSGDAGHQHGYKDQWENENVFSYTGEGQVDDMKFVKGNLALKEHLNNGKRVFLFIYVRKAHVRFETELELDNIDFFEGKDRDRNNRIAIKFFFKRKGVKLKYNSHDPEANIVASPKQPGLVNTPNETERKGLVTSRVGQGAYRKSILYRWEFKCAVTNFSNQQILIASHIIPWKGATNEERLDVNNGILLSPNYDALFDKHLISFENSGKIILSDSLKESNYFDIGISGKEKIRNLSVENYSYLERHRNKLTL